MDDPTCPTRGLIGTALRSHDTKMPRVRVATPEDRTRILDLHVASIRAFGPDAYDEQQVAAWARKPEGVDAYPVNQDEHHVVVGEFAGDVVGYGHLVPGKREVRAVYVHPEHDGEGVGSALLAHLEGYAFGVGQSPLRLWASRNAVGFYERMGYDAESEATITKPLEGEEVTLGVVEMAKSLCP
jgi:putative acetyltransferase